MPRAVIGAGSNLGSREAFLLAAERLLAASLPLLARSRLYETAPLGPPQPHYLNAAFAVALDRPAEALLARLLEIEAILGRERSERWGPRTLDLDLLHVEGWSSDAPSLTVPHPGLGDRAFAMAPLLDVAPWLEATYAPRLAALGGPPPTLPWGSARGPEDALARATNARLGDDAPRGAVRLEAADPPAWARAARSVPGACGAVIDALLPGRVVGRVLVAGPDSARRGVL